MENQTQPTPTKTNYSAKIGAILLVLLLIGSLGYAVFAWDQLSNKESHVAELESQNAALKKVSDTNKTAPTLSEDDKVVAAFNTHCNAIAIPEGFERNTVIGTMTVDQKKLVYSQDKAFVALNGKCDYKKVGSQDDGGGAATYILKKVDNIWVVVVTTQQRPADETIEKFAIPEEFLVTIGLN